MRDPQQARSKQIVALALMGSAVLLGTGAVLIFTGVLPFVAEEARGLVALALAAAAALDFVLGLWFFRMGQTS
jgi:hypothetical protein